MKSNPALAGEKPAPTPSIDFAALHKERRQLREAAEKEKETSSEGKEANQALTAA